MEPIVGGGGEAGLMRLPNEHELRAGRGLELLSRGSIEANSEISICRSPGRYGAYWS